MAVTLDKEKILTLVEQKGMSKAEFATKIGVHRQNLDYFFDHEKKDINTVIRIAETLGIPLLELIGYSQPERPSVYGCLWINGNAQVLYGKEKIQEALLSVN